MPTALTPQPPDMRLAWDLVNRKQPEEAAAIFRRKLDAAAGDIPARVGLAEVALLQSRPADAIRWLDEAEALVPDVRSRLWAVRGKALAALDQEGEADQAFRHYIEAQPGDPRGYQLLASHQRKTFRQLEALETLDSPVARASINCRVVAINCLVETWQIPRGMAFYDEAVALATAPAELGMLLNLPARLYGKGEGYRRALQNLQARLAAIAKPVKPALLCRILFALGDLDALRELAGRVPPGQLEPRADETVRRALGMVPSRRKVFGIGLSRTGTTSLNTALRMLGLSAQHWGNPLTMQMLDESDAQLYDAISDGWSADNFEHLAQRFPDSLFILTERDRTAWEKSYLEHAQARFSVDSLEGLRRKTDDPELVCPYGSAWRTLHQNLFTRHATLLEAYDAQTARALAFFAGQPGRLLRLPIEHPQPWQLICPFLGIAIPAEPYPHRNRRTTSETEAEAGQAP